MSFQLVTRHLPQISYTSQLLCPSEPDDTMPACTFDLPTRLRAPRFRFGDLGHGDRMGRCDRVLLARKGPACSPEHYPPPDTPWAGGEKGCAPPRSCPLIC